MITCYIRYQIDPYKVEEFEEYGRRWIHLVNRFGGQHHGYFLPHEGANNIAVAMFSFRSLAALKTTLVQSAQYRCLRLELPGQLPR